MPSLRSSVSDFLGGYLGDPPAATVEQSVDTQRHLERQHPVFLYVRPEHLLYFASSLTFIAAACSHTLRR